MKKYSFNIISISIACILALILIITIKEKNMYIDILVENTQNNIQCDLYYAEMSNYVINNYDNIEGFCNETLLNYSEITYKDSWGRTAIKKEAYDELLKKYHLDYFIDNKNAYIGDISENKINFTYYQKCFTNGYYASFEFIFENGYVKVIPYKYELIDKTE